LRYQDFISEAKKKEKKEMLLFSHFIELRARSKLALSVLKGLSSYT